MVGDVIGVEEIEEFTRELFERDEREAAQIVKAMLDAQSPRLSQMSHRMEGSPSSNVTAQPDRTPPHSGMCVSSVPRRNRIECPHDTTTHFQP